MEEARKQAKEFLNSLSRDELIELLTEVGFEVVEGRGEIVFTDVNYKLKPKSTFKF